MTTPNLMPEMSDKFDIILKSLMDAKNEIGSTVQNDSTNPFHKSKYASLGAHLAICKEPLTNNGLIMMQSVNGTNKEAILVVTIYHVESGQWVKSYLPLPNPKGDNQGLGASITYMRRYSISSMLGLTSEGDADGESLYPKEKEKEKPKTKTLTPPIEPPKAKLDDFKIQTLQNLNNELDGKSRAKINNWLVKTYKTTSYANLLDECYGKVLGVYENAVKFMKSEKAEVVQYA